MSTTRVTANTRLICGRDWDGNIQKLEDTEISSNDVCSLVIRETDLDDDEIDSIVDLLSNVTVDIIHLEDCWARNTDQSTIRLVVALGNCRDVRVSGSTFLSKSFLESFLKSATQLKRLQIWDHLLVDQVEALSRGIASNRLLHTLDLSRSCIDDFFSLIEGLRGGCIKVLRLRSIGLQDRHLKKMLTALVSPLLAPTMTASQSSLSSSSTPPLSSFSPSPTNAARTTLESLDISFNRLRNLDHIGKFLKRSDCNLKELFIGYQNLWQPSRNGGNIDISAITDALLHNARLIVLRLPRNELDDSDAIQFATALAENKTLESLDLSENNIHDKGVIALAETTRESRALKELNLKGNPFGSRASLALLDAATKNHNLFFLGDDDEDESDNDNDTTDEQGAIHSQIRYQTALNRGGRKLFSQGHNENSRSKFVPLGLWPLVLERQTSENKWEGSIYDSMRLDVLYYSLREGSTTFFCR